MADYNMSYSPAPSDALGTQQRAPVALPQQTPLAPQQKAGPVQLPVSTVPSFTPTKEQWIQHTPQEMLPKEWFTPQNAGKVQETAQDITEGVKDQIRSLPTTQTINPYQEIKKTYGSPDEATSGTSKTDENGIVKPMGIPGKEEAYHKQYTKLLANPDIKQFNQDIPISKLPDVLDTLNYLDVGPSSVANNLKKDIHDEMLNQIPKYVPEAKEAVDAINELKQAHKALSEPAAMIPQQAPQRAPVSTLPVESQAIMAREQTQPITEQQSTIPTASGSAPAQVALGSGNMDRGALNQNLMSQFQQGTPIGSLNAPPASGRRGVSMKALKRKKSSQP